MQALIIKISAVGDSIMAMPMVTALRRRDPAVRVAWICSETVVDLLALVGDIEIIPVSERKLFNGSLPERVFEVMKIWGKLLRRRFDLVAVGHINPIFRLLVLTASVGQWRSFHSKRRLMPVPGRYHGDEYVRLITDIDGPDAESAELLTVKLPLAQPLLSRLGGSAADLIVLAPGGAKNAISEQPLRRWPVESYRSVAAELLARGFRVALTGASSDDWVRAAFDGLPVTDLIGRTSLLDQLALFGACALVVTHDSGPLHVAQLAGAPVLVLFGPTNPAEKVRDATRVKVIWGGASLACRPCYDNFTYAPCANNRCMREISVEDVVRAIEEVFARSDQQSRQAGAGRDHR
jgi:heptosyltransferase II